MGIFLQIYLLVIYYYVLVNGIHLLVKVCTIFFFFGQPYFVFLSTRPRLFAVVLYLN